MPPRHEQVAASDLPIEPSKDHKLLSGFIREIRIAPCLTAAAFVPPSTRIDEEKLYAETTAVFDNWATAPRYPEVSTPSESPIWRITSDVPFVLTPLSITVTILAQFGIPVKSIAVPLVVFWAVPSVGGWDSFAGVTDPSAGVELMALVETVVTRPLASSVRVTAAVLVP